MMFSRRAITKTKGFDWMFVQKYDADITIEPGVSKNLSIDSLSSGRTDPSGKAFAVTALASRTATLSTVPTSSQLEAGDICLLINIQGAPNIWSQTGNWEIVTVRSILGNVVTFSEEKTKYYGNTLGTDIGIGTTHNVSQRVMLQRVPNVENITIGAGSTLTTNPWDTTTGNGGIVVIRAKRFINNGIVDVMKKGWVSGGDTLGYAGTPGCTGPGDGWQGILSGAGHATQGGSGGNTNYGTPAAGGVAYGVADLSKIFFGEGNVSGVGGGIAMIIADEIVGLGTILSNSSNSSQSSGGSIYVKAFNSLTYGTNSLAANGFANNPSSGYWNAYSQWFAGPSSAGRIAIHRPATVAGTLVSSPAAYLG